MPLSFACRISSKILGRAFSILRIRCSWPWLANANLPICMQALIENSRQSFLDLAHQMLLAMAGERNPVLEGALTQAALIERAGQGARLAAPRLEFPPELDAERRLSRFHRAQHPLH